MSEEDERMDRAERIRQLRQGRRGGQTDDTTDDGSDTAGGQSADEKGDTSETPESRARSDSPTDPTGAAESTAEPETETQADGDERHAGAEDPARAAVASETDGASDRNAKSGGAAGESTHGESETDGEDAALAAAQAAAESAAAFETGGDLSEAGAGGDATDESGADTGNEVAPAGATVAGEAAEETTDVETRVLEFRLGEERYCLDIEYVEEIVREETVTRVPNTPKYVEGVVDLRGQITTILDPTVAAEIDTTNDDQLLVVFDPGTFEDYGAIGWLVDAVDQVSLIAESEVKDAPVERSSINGVIERDDEFVIWTTPELALDVIEEE